MVIQRDGTRALERLSNDIELVMLLRFVKTSLFNAFGIHKCTVYFAENFISCLVYMIMLRALIISLLKPMSTSLEFQGSDVKTIASGLPNASNV